MLLVDNFAGGGGASLGIAEAMGRPVDFAINHCAEALEMHRANHPETEHLREDVWDVDPALLVNGRGVELTWFSPDCKHFSRAKGGKPVEKRIRGLAWVAVKWAKTTRPRLMFLENVAEFQDWGPLDAHGHPIASKKGLTFRRFIGNLRALGYRVEYRVLNAADYGAPTHRRRLFMVARRDGLPIVWPQPTHGPGRTQPWRPAAEIIDWSLPCPSIFGRKRPLAEATQRRIARGLERFVFAAAEPFFVETANGEREGQAPRVRSLREPLRTVRASGSQGAVCVPFLMQYFGGMVGKPATDPLPTVTAIDHNALVCAFLTKFYGTSVGSSLRAPLPTVTGQGQHLGHVSAFLIKYFGNCLDGQPVTEPLHTVTSKARFGLVMVKGVPYRLVDIGLRMLTPRELARAQGFPESYQLTGSKTSQIARIGNSVCPIMAEALVRANA
jgi:DNA (cytosine-5)-methyltransferase 1